MLHSCAVLVTNSTHHNTIMCPVSSLYKCSTVFGNQFIHNEILHVWIHDNNENENLDLDRSL